MMELYDMVNNIAYEITNGVELDADEHSDILEDTGQEPGDMMYASDYLRDALDIEYIISSAGDYLGARILVTFGGPNIWIDTQRGMVEGYWGGEESYKSFQDNMGLDDYMEEMFSCIGARK